MITIDQSEQRISIAVFGEFTLADYREFEEIFNYTHRFKGPVDLFIDLREMAGFTVDVAWEDIKFSRQHSKDFRRIAVLTESEWLTWSAWVTQLFVDGQVLVFNDEAEALAWIETPTESIE
ncbi:SpoIIAA family protein [Pseudazoarcus pumilus]|uniref:STAS/SEC14 domain-containing protein n=1 Tax=Pseudazoarcus pumilus TaxID=2067960 RepID=A0A2I6S8R0_9RHOO|nr:STAS/SEC14 domain-containing protein [Pseudazoarcus pumilus]AUN95611.1 STAS/SEC14 domain-containing protein [Pseudazoarcus pumilus]